MTSTVDELMADAWKDTHPFEVEVKCDTCPEACVVTYIGDEPVEKDALVCSCGGRLEPV